MTLYEILKKNCTGPVMKDEPLSNHTSFRIGGPADCFVRAEMVEDVGVAMEAAAHEGGSCIIIGNGTNLLVADEGVRGVVLRLGRAFDTVDREGTSVNVGAAYDLQKLVTYCAGNGLGGLEFAAGIPGTVGGAIYTDANTRTGWIHERPSLIRMIEADKQTRTMDADAFLLETNATSRRGCILGATIELSRAPAEDIQREVERYLERRRDTQPIDQPSAGCIFRNPADQSAGKLIDQCGCKGMRIGGAVVSALHANFIINSGGARAQDVLELAELVRGQVLAETGVRLELEINVIGSE